MFADENGLAQEEESSRSLQNLYSEELYVCNCRQILLG